MDTKSNSHADTTPRLSSYDAPLPDLRLFVRSAPAPRSRIDRRAIKGVIAVPTAADIKAANVGTCRSTHPWLGGGVADHAGALRWPHPAPHR
jgi:hypothetical protein